MVSVETLSAPEAVMDGLGWQGDGSLSLADAGDKDPQGAAKRMLRQLWLLVTHVICRSISNSSSRPSGWPRPENRSGTA